MYIYPAIDIRGGNAVRLFNGDYSKEKVYSINPVEVACRFKAEGASRLHVVDLDGALEGELVNKDIIKNIVSQTGLFVEVGGGVRTVICTDISRDGALAGTNLAAYRKLVKIDGLKIIASGGITYYEELLKLRDMGVRGAVVGKAIYDGAIEVSKAVELCERC